MGFAMFWDEWHFGQDDYNDYDDYMDCEWKEIWTSCSDFAMFDYDCGVQVSYSPCEDDYFMCQITLPADMSPYGLVETVDCAEDFEDIQFWTQMREEQWWHESVNAEYADFYMFWDEYHFGDYGSQIGRASCRERV